MKSALVYDWFAEGTGGGEKAFEAIYELFPSPIFSLLKSPEATLGSKLQDAEFHTSFIQKLPRSLKKYKSYLPFFPLAIEQFDLSSYDLILSCSHCVAKGVLTHSDQLHLCYCYTPMRYAWDLYHQYIDDAQLQKGIKSRIAQFFLHYIRLWDVQSANRVDSFAAISSYVAKRIQKTYGRTAQVIYPPVNLEYFHLVEEKEEFYLTASRLVPYKKIDSIVDAFKEMPDKKLIVIGDGPDFEKIQERAGKNVELLGYQSNESLRFYLQRAKAFIFAAIEDFGILPVEAQACGTPVIALNRGATRETVVEGETGIYFENQSPAAIQNAVHEFEKVYFNPHTIREHAEKFNRRRFDIEFQNWVERELDQFRKGDRCTY